MAWVDYVTAISTAATTVIGYLGYKVIASERTIGFHASSPSVDAGGVISIQIQATSGHSHPWSIDSVKLVKPNGAMLLGTTRGANPTWDASNGSVERAVNQTVDMGKPAYFRVGISPPSSDWSGTITIRIRASSILRPSRRTDSVLKIVAAQSANHGIR